LPCRRSARPILLLIHLPPQPSGPEVTDRCLPPMDMFRSGHEIHEIHHKAYPLGSGRGGVPRSFILVVPKTKIPFFSHSWLSGFFECLSSILSFHLKQPILSDSPSTCMF
jgi:hypothetical protein